jgi:hypothetical protein
MKNKQMTAVEWLQERINIGLTYEQEVLFEGLFEQAKEMEKKQVINAHLNGQSEFDTDAYRYKVIANAEEYYNETYKK